ncbi:MAG: hypothetical protein ACRD2B_08795, partial [Terriglobia bacterium]
PTFSPGEKVPDVGGRMRGRFSHAEQASKSVGGRLFLSATVPDFLVRLIRETIGPIPATKPDPAKGEGP